MIHGDAKQSDADTILFLIDDNSCLQYFCAVISMLLENGPYNVQLVARTGELAQDIQKIFPTAQLLTGYSQETFQTSSAGLIVCCQIWWWGIASYLEEAVRRNIPVLHYDHGSLIHTSEYLLENNEYGSGYRNDVYRCSHIACWGGRGKECWVSFGVPEEKLYVTGAIHLDHLRHVSVQKKQVFEALQIPENKKIIFVYTALTGQLPHFDSAQIPYIEALESYVAKKPQYQLVVKSHPSEMLWFKNHRYGYSPSTILIANPVEDCLWPDITRISADGVVAVSDVVVSPFSSALLTPLSLNVPIVLMQYESPLVRDFTNYCKNVIKPISSAGQLAEALESLEQKRCDSSVLAKQFNHENDGNACKRFLALIDTIFTESRKGVQFYGSEEEERLLSVRRYPFLSYPYHYLIKYYLASKDADNVDLWLDSYVQKFQNPSTLLKELALHYVSIWNDYPRAKRCLELYSAYKPLDFELLQLYKTIFFALSPPA
jgi:hypothetical protein